MSTQANAGISQRPDSIRIYIFPVLPTGLCDRAETPFAFFSSTKTPFLGTLPVIVRKEDAIGRPAKTTLAKRDREKSKQMKQREKEARREQRKTEKAERPQRPEGDDPDLAGLHWGPQDPLY